MKTRNAAAILIATACLGLAGNALCAPVDTAAVPEGVPTPEEVLRIPPALAEQFHEHVMSSASRPQDRADLLTEFFRRPSGLDMAYAFQPTLTVARSFEQRQGNCLSFTLMFIALARKAGLSAWAREVRMPPLWNHDDDLLYSTGHVNVGLHTGSARAVVDFEPDFLLSHLLATPRRGRKISDQRALAHFYNNRGAELLAEGRLHDARNHLEFALQMDPGFSPVWNNSGVLHRRQGDLAAAEHAFKTALEYDAESASAMFNLVALYRHTGDQAAMEVYQARLGSIRVDDPYYQFEIGHRYEHAGDYKKAHEHYHRAVRLSPNDHRLQFALSRVHYRLGNFREAERSLAQAMELSESGRAHDRYQAKFEALRRVSAEL